MSEPQVAVPAQRTARWEDFIDLFYAPAAVFRRREHEGFAIPILVVTVAMAILAFTNSGVLQPVFDAEYNRNIAKVMQQNPQLTADAIEKGRQIAQMFQRIGAIVLVPVIIFVIGFVTWLVGKLVDARQALAAAVMVAAYAFVPRVVEGIVNGVQGLLLDPSSLNGIARLEEIGPARFFDPASTSPILMAGLSRLNLFVLWETVLLAIGLSVTGKISRGRAAAAAAIVWLLGALPALLAALRQS